MTTDPLSPAYAAVIAAAEGIAQGQQPALPTSAEARDAAVQVFCTLVAGKLLETLRTELSRQVKRDGANSETRLRWDSLDILEAAQREDRKTVRALTLRHTPAEYIRAIVTMAGELVGGWVGPEKARVFDSLREQFVLAVADGTGMTQHGWGDVRGWLAMHEPLPPDLQRREDARQAADDAVAHWPGTQRLRLATPAERWLLAWLGFDLPSDLETEVRFVSGSVRRREWPALQEQFKTMTGENNE